MKLSRGITLFLTFMILTVGMVGAVSATTAEIYADTSSLGIVDVDVTYTIPVNISACGKSLLSFAINQYNLTDSNGNVYVYFDTANEYDELAEEITIKKPKNKISNTGSYVSYGPQGVMWQKNSVGSGLNIDKELTMYYINITVNGSMKYPNALIPINVTLNSLSEYPGVASYDAINVTKYITVNYPPSVVTSVNVTAPTGSLAYKATGTAAATVKDQYGDIMIVDLEWTSSDSSVLTIDASTGAYEVVGCTPATVTITATNTSTGIFGQTTVSLTKATPVKDNFTCPTFADLEWTGSSLNYTNQISLASGVYGLDYTVVYNNGAAEVDPIDYGKYTVIARVAGTSANYTAGDVELGSYNITKKQIVRPSLNDYSYTYNTSAIDAPITLNPTNYTVSGETTATAAGTYHITVALADKTNTVWDDNTVADLSFDWTIAQKVLTDNATVTLDKTDVQYTASAITAAVSSVTLAAPYVTLAATDYTVSGATTGTAVGMYTVTVTGQGNYTGAETATWNITKADPVDTDFTCNPTLPKQIEFDGNPHYITVTSTKVAPTSITTKYYNSTSKAEVTDPTTYGTYLVNVSVSGDPNYNDAEVTLGTLEITRTLPKVADFSCVLPSDLVFNTSEKLATVTTSIQELDGKFTVMYNQSGVSVSPTAAGIYDVVVQTQDTTNYSATTLTLTSFTITQKPMTDATVTLSATDFTYNGVEQTVTVTRVNFTDTWVLTDSTDYDVTGTLAATAANTYTVTVTGKDNYSGTKSATWIINKATPVVDNFTASNASGTVTFPLDVDFNNSEHTVTVAPATGVYGMGTITTTYKNASSGQIETPKKVGTYYVNVSTVAGANFTAVSDLNLGEINVNTKSYTITYETNGGTAIDSETYNAGAEIKVLNTSTNKTGYHLDGWYANIGLTGAKVTQIGMEEFGDKTYYAKWLNNTYQVHFDKNSTLATGTMANQGFTYGAPAVALTANAFSYPGYHFANWTNATDGTGVLFADKEAVQNLNETDGGITTLYAVWEPNTYTVHFDGNRNTSGSMADQAFTYDAAPVALTANGFLRTGYNFTNWTTNADGTGLSFADGESVQNLTTENNGTVPLYAKWNATGPKVFYNASGIVTLDSGYVVSTINVSTANITSITFAYDQTIPKPYRSGYHDQITYGDAFNISLYDGDFDGGKAVIYFNVSMSDLGSRSVANIWLAHYVNGAWEFLPTVKEADDGVNIMFSAETSSFSPFWPMHMILDTPVYSGVSSSRHSGGSMLLLPGQTAPVETYTPEPTVASTPIPTADVPSVPVSSNPTTQQTQKSPAPIVGLIAGLGAAALVLARLRKEL